MFYGNPGNRDKARWDSWLVRRLRVGKTEHPHSAPRKRVLYRWLRRFWVYIITHVYECIVKYAHIWFNYRSDIKKRDWYPPHSFRYIGRHIQIENIYFQDDIHHLVLIFSLFAWDLTLSSKATWIRKAVSAAFLFVLTYFNHLD